MSRTRNSVRNAAVGLVAQVILLALSLVARAVFVAHLGIEFVGLDSMFLSIITMLTLADAGLSGAVIFAMYQPLAEGNTERLASLVQFTQRIYRVVASLVFAAGLAVMPFLRGWAGLSTNVPHLELYYLILLASIAGNYLFSYRLTLLLADQKLYLIRLYNLGFQGVRQCAQIVVLISGLGYLPYVVLQAAGTLANGWFGLWKCGQLYPYLRRRAVDLPAESRQDVVRSVKALLIYRVAGVVINNSTPFLVVLMLGASAGGHYANYALVAGAIIMLIDVLFGGALASVGDFVARNNRRSARALFDELMVFGSFLYGAAAVGMAVCIDDLVTLWLGREFLLDRPVVAVIAISLLVQGLMTPIVTFRQATGLFHEARYVLVLTAILNIALAFGLGAPFGLAGILASAPVARVLSSVWIEPLMLFRRHLVGALLPWLVRMAAVAAACTIVVAVVWSIDLRTPSVFLDLLLHGLLGVLLTIGCVALVWLRTSALSATVGRVLRTAHRQP